VLDFFIKKRDICPEYRNRRKLVTHVPVKRGNGGSRSHTRETCAREKRKQRFTVTYKGNMCPGKEEIADDGHIKGKHVPVKRGNSGSRAHTRETCAREKRKQRFTVTYKGNMCP